MHSIASTSAPRLSIRRKRDLIREAMCAPLGAAVQTQDGAVSITGLVEKHNVISIMVNHRWETLGDRIPVAGASRQPLWEIAA